MKLQSKLLKLSMNFVKIGPNLAGQIPDKHKSLKEYFDTISHSILLIIKNAELWHKWVTS